MGEDAKPATKLAAVQNDLVVLNALQHIFGEARIAAKEWPKAQQVLDWLEARIKAREAKLATLLPPPPPPESLNGEAGGPGPGAAA